MKSTALICGDSFVCYLSFSQIILFFVQTFIWLYQLNKL